MQALTHYLTTIFLSVIFLSTPGELQAESSIHSNLKAISFQSGNALLDHFTKNHELSATNLSQQEKDLNEYIQIAKKNNWQDANVILNSYQSQIYVDLGKQNLAMEIIKTWRPAAVKNQLHSAVLRFYYAEVSMPAKGKTLNKLNSLHKDYLDYAKRYGKTRELADAHNIVSHSWHAVDMTHLALEHAKKSLRYYEQLNDRSGIVKNFNSIALIFERQSDFEQAIDYYKRALQEGEFEKNPLSKAIVLGNLGNSLILNKEYAKAIPYLNEALQISSTLQDELGIAFVKRSLSRIHAHDKQWDKAETLLRDVLKIFSKFNNKSQVYFTTTQLSRALANQNKTDEARALLKPWEDWALAQDNLSAKHYYYLSSYTIEKMDQRYKNALDSHEKYFSFIEAETKAYREKSMQSLMIQFDLEQKEAQNALLQKENELNKSRIIEKEQQGAIWFLSVVISIFLAIFVTVTLVYQIRRRNEYKRLAFRDDLTGALNRRAILFLAQQKFNEFVRQKKSFIVLLFDIDHFKSFNDTYGHDAGDEVLKLFANACAKVMRKQDRFGRYGGEEWLGILIGDSPDSVENVFDRLSSELDSLTLPQLSQPLSIKFSLGAAIVVDEDDSIDDTIKRADIRLYEAKENGRDQFVI